MVIGVRNVTQMLLVQTRCDHLMLCVVSIDKALIYIISVNPAEIGYRHYLGVTCNLR